MMRADTVLLLVTLPFAVSGCQNQQEPSAAEMKAVIDEVDRITGYAGPSRGNVPPPAGMDDAVSSFSPAELFREASGYYVSFNNRPALYAGGGANGRLVVVGPQFQREFALSDFESAVQAYRDLLRRQGYLPHDK